MSPPMNRPGLLGSVPRRGETGTQATVSSRVRPGYRPDFSVERRPMASAQPERRGKKGLRAHALDGSSTISRMDGIASREGKGSWELDGHPTRIMLVDDEEDITT